jgi:hypothetical protein
MPLARSPSTVAMMSFVASARCCPVVAVRDHLAHQRRIFGRDVAADELGHVHESHDPVVEADPFVHLAQLHVADHVIERLEVPPRRAWRAAGLGGPSSGH